MSPLKELLKVFRASLGYKKSWRTVVVLVLILPLTALLFYWCHTTNSLALTSFAYLSIFDIGSLLCSLLSVWASKQEPTIKFSYGLERVNVLSIFTITILLILFGVNLIKHSSERIFQPPIVSTECMFLGLCLGLAVHLMVACGVNNTALLHTAHAATPNWMQNALNDFGNSVCAVSPALGRLLLQKLDPLSLLVAGEAISVLITQLLIDLDELYLADVAGALFNAALICGTMLPLSIYTAKILLQTAPEHVLPLLDKSLREASTLEGVLELKNEHFWTIAFGAYAGSLHVRVRRDANEQEVLTQLTSRLSSQLNDLTIQIVKDDWSIPTLPVAVSPSVISPTRIGPPKISHTPSPLSPSSHPHPSTILPSGKGTTPSSPHTSQQQLQLHKHTMQTHTMGQALI